jgi:cell division protein FtsN
MTNRYLMSVAAAALIAGTGFAYAQGTGTSREAPSSGAAPTQQVAPPSDRGSAATPMNRDSSQSGAPAEAPKSAQSKEMAPKGEKSAQDNMKGEKGAAGKDMKADSKGAADSKGTADNKAGSNATDSKTTGNAATSATAAPPAEKRGQIASAIKSEKIQETTNVNFNISVGASIPSGVRFHPLPPRIVEIYPEWRGYEVVYVRGQYIIVRPQTREIVYIIEG